MADTYDILRVVQKLNATRDELQGQIGEVKAAVDAIPYIEGPIGPKGEKGDAGARGPQGPEGVGKDGEDGKDAVQIADVDVDFDNHLRVTMADGTVHDAGAINVEAALNNAHTSVNISQGGGGSAIIPVKDEGIEITAEVTSFDFTGTGVTATSDASGNVTVDVPAVPGPAGPQGPAGPTGPQGPTGASPITSVQKNDVEVVADLSTLNFAESLRVTDDGAGKATINLGPLEEDLDADGFDLFDLSQVRFRAEDDLDPAAARVQWSGDFSLSAASSIAAPMVEATNTITSTGGFNFLGSGFLFWAKQTYIEQDASDGFTAAPYTLANQNQFHLDAGASNQTLISASVLDQPYFRSIGTGTLTLFDYQSFRAAPKIGEDVTGTVTALAALGWTGQGADVGTVTNLRGVVTDGAFNNTNDRYADTTNICHFLMGTDTSPAGEWGIYQADTTELANRWSGSQAYKYDTFNLAATVTLDDTHHIVRHTGGTARVQNLPGAGTVPSGREYVIKNVGSGAVTVTGFGGQLIDNANTYVLSQWEYVRLASTGSGWIIVGKG